MKKASVEEGFGSTTSGSVLDQPGSGEHADHLDKGKRGLAGVEFHPRVFSPLMILGLSRIMSGIARERARWLILANAVKDRILRLRPRMFFRGFVVYSSPC